MTRLTLTRIRSTKASRSLRGFNRWSGSVLPAFLFALLSLVGTVPHAFAQTTTGTIGGTVTDSSGAAIPNATVTLTNSATHAARSATTGGSGDYGFSLLEPGTYSVQVTEAGFKSVTIPAIQLAASDSARADARPEIEAIAEVDVQTN